MYDPKTVAFDILYPWEYPRKWFNILFNRKNIYYNTMVTIWHVDPEKDNTDDSCGWFFGKLNDNDKKIIKRISNDYSLKCLWNKIPRKKDNNCKNIESSISNSSYLSCQNAGYTYEFVYNVFRQILWDSQNLHYSLKRRNLNKKERIGLESLVYNMIDNLQFSVCNPDAELENVVRCCYRNWKRLHRPWYRHPRWHIHHWELQIHFFCSIRRKIFTKCNVCNKRFPYGYCPTSSSWDSPKVKWYESEKGLSCGSSTKEECNIKNNKSINKKEILKEK